MHETDDFPESNTPKITAYTERRIKMGKIRITAFDKTFEDRIEAEECIRELLDRGVQEIHVYEQTENGEKAVRTCKNETEYLETGQLIRGDDYFGDLYINGWRVAYGSTLDVLIPDEKGEPSWVRTTLERNLEGFHFPDLPEVKPQGVFARVIDEEQHVYTAENS